MAIEADILTICHFLLSWKNTLVTLEADDLCERLFPFALADHPAAFTLIDISASSAYAILMSFQIDQADQVAALEADYRL